MAQRYRKIDPRMWRDECFHRLEHIEKLIAIYAFTAQSNRIGIFSFSPALAAEDLSLDAAEFRGRFEKVCRTFDWRFDEQHRVLYIPTWWKYNTPENPSVLKNCLKDLHDLPATPLLEGFFANGQHLPERLLRVFETCSPARVPPRAETSSPTRVGVKEQEQEQEQEQDQDSGSSERSSKDDDHSEQAEPKRPKKRSDRRPVTHGDGEVVIVLPLTSDKEAPVTEDFVAEMAKAYPGVDVRLELGRMRAWLIANPTRKRTVTGIGRFVSSWLSKQQDSGGTRTARTPRGTATTQPPPERKTDFRDRMIDGEYMREEFDVETGASIKVFPHPSTRRKA